MANIIKKNGVLEKEKERLEKKTSRAANWLLVILILNFINMVLLHGRYSLITVPALILSAIVYTCYNRKYGAIGSGAAGESAVAKIVATLPDSYTGIQNLKVTCDGKTSELDMVIVGPTGVFVIEAKNHNSEIQGSYDNTQWMQHKVGRGGTPYTNRFYSPIKQVGTHVYRLANYLRAQNVPVYVHAMVYFSNPQTSLEMAGIPGKIPVFCASENGAKKMEEHILSGPKKLSAERIAQILTVLDCEPAVGESLKTCN